MTKYIKSLILGGFVAGLLSIAGPALAYSPTLSANYQGGNDNVQITVSNAATFSQVNLSYRQSSTLWTTVNNIGQTDGSGYFTQVVSMPSDYSSSQVQLYVTVGGQQSSTISIYPGSSGTGGCGYYGCSVGGLTISPSSLSVSVGQSASSYVSIGSYIYSGSYYIASNSNSSVASASISGSTINVYGLASGSATISVCSTGSTCSYLYVTVSGGSNYGGNIYFSPSSLTLTAGQNSNVSIYNNSGYSSGSYYISSNSNSSVASAYVSGSSLYVSGLVSGSTSISVCQSSYSNCATLYVTVSGSSYGSLSLSQTSVSMTVGQSLTVTAYNAPAVYISSNSSPSVVTSSLDVNKINLYANSAGSSTIYVCAISSSTQCAYIYVTVSGSGTGGYGNIYFTTSNVSLTAGQSQTVTIYNNNNYNYNNSYYISSNGNPNVATASISGSSLYLNGLASGSTSISVCQNNVSSCATLYVTVTGSVLGSNTNLWFSPANPNLYVGQSLAVSINSSAYAAVYPYYNNTSYYISSNSNSNIASASISGTVLNLYAYQNGSTSISVCHSSLSYCSTLYVTVGGGSSGGNLSVSQPSVTVGINQNVNVTVYGSGSYYISSNSNSGVATASLSGNALSIYGRQYGSTTLSICQSGGYSACVSVYVTVSGYSNGGGLTYPGVLGASTYANGQLISENGTVYIVYKNTKTGFVSAGVFTGLGYKFSNVTEVGNSGLVDSGYAIRTNYSSHPWGAWVKSGVAVYMVHEQGLIPVPDWNTFLNNAGQAGFIVSANLYDLALPRLSPMTYGDVRLQ